MFVHEIKTLASTHGIIYVSSSTKAGIQSNKTRGDVVSIKEEGFAFLISCISTVELIKSLIDWLYRRVI